MSIWYVDYVNGDDTNGGTSWADAVKTIQGVTAAMLNPGDEVRIAKSPDPTSLGQNATFVKDSKTTILTSSVTVNICDCDNSWTDSSGITSTIDTSKYREGLGSVRIKQTGSFTTGLASYFSFDETDFSGYTQVSFWINSGYTITSSKLSLRLCSDSNGAVTVNTIPIPSVPATLNLTTWIPITVETGSALSSSVKSIALYVDDSVASMDFYLDNIIACKSSVEPDSLTLSSLIGIDPDLGETWYGIRSINGTTVIFDESTRTYTGPTEGNGSRIDGIYEIFKRETIQTGYGSTSQQTQDSGISGNLIAYSGGWNTTLSYDNQDGETWYDGSNCVANGLNIGNGTFTYYVSIDKLSFVRYSTGLYMLRCFNCLINNMAVGNNIRGIYVMGNYNQFINIDTQKNEIESAVLDSCSYSTFSNIRIRSSVAQGLETRSIITACIFSNLEASSIQSDPGSSYYGLDLSNVYLCSFDGLNAYDNTNAGLSQTTCFNNSISNASFSGNGIDIYIYSDSYGLLISNASLSSTTQVDFGSIKFSSVVNVSRLGQTPGRYKTWQSYSDGSTGVCGTISDQITGGQDAAWAYGGEGTCAYFTPNSVVDPLVWEFYVPVTAATDFQVNFWHRITLGFGGSMDVTIYDSNDNATKLLDSESVDLNLGESSNDWNEYTSTTCTPTDTGFCRVHIEFLNGSTSATIGSVGVDNVRVTPVVNDDFGSMDRWLEGLPPKYMTDGTIKYGAAFSS